jgi:hypothetical protein
MERSMLRFSLTVTLTGRQLIALALMLLHVLFA